MIVKLEDTIDGTFGTATFATGAATDADGTPTCVVLEQGTAMAYAPTCTNKAVGLYNVQIVCSAANGFEVGKQYSSYVVVTMGGVVTRGPVAGVSAFTVRAQSVDTVTTALVATAVLAETIHAGWSVARALRVMGGMIAGKLSGAAANAPVARFLDDSGDAVTGVSDDDGNRTTATHGA